MTTPYESFRFYLDCIGDQDSINPYSFLDEILAVVILVFMLTFQRQSNSITDGESHMERLMVNLVRGSVIGLRCVCVFLNVFLLGTHFPLQYIITRLENNFPDVCLFRSC